MKKMLKKSVVAAAVAAALATAGCEKTNEPELIIDPVEPIVVLTFEDSDYQGGVSGYWTSLVDSPEYGGHLLYGEDPTDWTATDIEYEWCDKDGTNLSGGTFTEYGFSFSFGGSAISNYVIADETTADYTRQLSLWSEKAQGKGGHNDSANFCVVYTGLGMGMYPELRFADGKEYTIDHLYIANIAWVANSLLNVAGEKGGADDWFSVTATGYDADDEVTGESEFFLFEKGRIVKEWTKWDLTSLGKVAYIAFECKGSVMNGYGLATPAYFAIDDVAVVKFGQGNE